MIRHLTLGLTLSLIVVVDVRASSPSSFDPQVLGWARETVGGRGGEIVRVTSLAASGPGSLRAAIERAGPRIVVFEVGGVIDLKGERLSIAHPYITIAGQTAPEPGITVIRGETVVTAHDVIVQHMRFRPGEYGRPKRGGDDHDGISTAGGAYNVVVDHCSLSWATDENLSASGPRFQGETPDAWRRATSNRITFSNNLIYEGLSHSVHVKGEHSKGTLIHDNVRGVLLYQNVYVSNRERNALFKGGTQGAMVNNLIVNPGTRAVHYNLHANEWGTKPYQIGQITLIGNVLRHGADTVAHTPLFTLRGDGDVELYAADNLSVDRDGVAVPPTANLTGGKAKILVQTAPLLPADVTPIAASEVESRVLEHAGARPWSRDAIDRRLVANVRKSVARIIDSEADVEGLPPVRSATHRRFDAAAWQLDPVRPRSGWAQIVKLVQPDASH